MKVYSPYDVKTILEQASKLHIPMFKELSIGEVEVLVKHKMLEVYGEPISQITINF